MKTMLAAAATIALMATNPVAAAQVKTATRAGVEAARGAIWYSEHIPGTPAVSFPLGCEATGTCLYEIWFEFVPAGQMDPVFTDIFDLIVNPDNPGFAEIAQCVTWVRRSPALQPMKDPGVDHFIEGSPVPSDDSMLSGIHPARRVGPGSTIGGSSGVGGPASGGQFIGSTYQMLLIGRWWVELNDDNCLFGFHACYHPSIKTFESRALTCPLKE